MAHQNNIELVDNTLTLLPRNLGTLLNETFSIFGKHLWSFVGLVAITQVPLSLLSMFLLQLFDGEGNGGLGSLAAVFVLGVLGNMLTYAAVVYAVSQQYLTRGIMIRTCYYRAWWKIISLVMIAAALSATMLAVVALPLFTDGNWSLLFAAVLVVPALALTIYWSMAVQAVIIEGHRMIGALKRSLNLVRGSWWRIFGITIVLSLVALGLAILVRLPFELAIVASGTVDGSLLSNIWVVLSDIMIRIAVLPVLFIAGTLLYYDVRVRNEKYDLATLSRELEMVLV